MPSRSTTQKIGRASCENTKITTVTIALPTGAKNDPRWSRTPSRRPSPSTAIIATGIHSVVVTARRTHRSRSAAGSSSASSSVHTEIARLASEPTKNTGIRTMSGGPQSCGAAVPTTDSTARTSAPPRNEPAIGSRQSRNASPTARSPRSRNSSTTNTSRCVPPRASRTPAAIAAIAMSGATLDDVRYRVASATATVNVTRNTGMNAATGIVAPAPLVTTVCTGRHQTDASAIAAGTAAATAARTCAPSPAAGVTSERITRRPPDVPPTGWATRGSRRTRDAARAPSRG